MRRPQGHPNLLAANSDLLPTLQEMWQHQPLKYYIELATNLLLSGADVAASLSSSGFIV
jgi:hypothetical protein